MYTWTALAGPSGLFKKHEVRKGCAGGIEGAGGENKAHDASLCTWMESQNKFKAHQYLSH